MDFQTINPANQETLSSYSYQNQQAVNRSLDAAVAAYQAWSRRTVEDRVGQMGNVASVLESRVTELALLMTTEMGKPLTESRSELEKCIWVCNYYMANASDFLADQPVETDASESMICHAPLGPVLAIMPWNFPFWQVFRFAIPALCAGNVGLLKHSENVTGCSLAIQSIFEDANLPTDVFQSFIVTHDQVEEIIGTDAVAAVTLTGSTRAGKHIASVAGRHLKKTVLELGGSDPYVILADANLDSAVNACVTSRMINGGQSCIAAKRFVVVREVASHFEEAFVDAMSKKVVGDPTASSTDVGPLARQDLVDELHRQVLESIAGGASLALGGAPIDGAGSFYQPTVLTNVQADTPAYNEELFGPVASIIVAEDEDDAIRIANDTRFGLGSAVFTEDIERGRRIAREELEAGSCFVNTFVRSDPRLPFGGIRESGYGRELSREGILEFTNTKTVYIN
ncbi:MAG: NAD-dependent succinate-semialdehyde dehydrogenase [Rhodothermales bacterium]|nr:NAD-dependent succinate-semialdehyde dehydrogenase [Rhodothermales bacterium]